MVRTLRFLVFLLAVTSTAFGFAENPGGMKCIWVSVNQNFGDCTELDSCSIASQYLGKSIYVTIDTINDNYWINNFDMPSYKLEKHNPTVYRWYNEAFVGSFYSSERHTRTLYAKFSEDFKYLTLKEVIHKSESSRHQYMKSETTITAYYVIDDIETQPCTSQREFDNKFLKIWNCPRCKGTGHVTPNPNPNCGPDWNVGICPLCSGHTKHISSPFK